MNMNLENFEINNTLPFLTDYVTPQRFGAKGDGVADDTNGAPLNSHIYASRNHLSFDGDFVTIPAEAKYAYIGFDIRKEGGLKADTYCVISDMTYEFL